MQRMLRLHDTYTSCVPQCVTFPVTFQTSSDSYSKVWTWDALTSLPDDVEMFTGRRKAWVDIIYVLSR